MEKEQLTKERILADIRYYQEQGSATKRFRAGEFVVLCSLLVALLTFLLTFSPYAFLFLLVPAAVLPLCSLLKRKNVEEISEKDLSVCTGQLASVEENMVNHWPIRTMYFEDGGEWTIPELNYKWSKAFCMSSRGVDNTSLRGDTFYLVRLKDTGKIAAAYNAKFFAYRES